MSGEVGINAADQDTTRPVRSSYHNLRFLGTHRARPSHYDNYDKHTWLFHLCDGPRHLYGPANARTVLGRWQSIHVQLCKRSNSTRVHSASKQYTSTTVKLPPQHQVPLLQSNTAIMGQLPMDCTGKHHRRRIAGLRILHLTHLDNIHHGRIGGIPTTPLDKKVGRDRTSWTARSASLVEAAESSSRQPRAMRLAAPFYAGRCVDSIHGLKLRIS